MNTVAKTKTRTTRKNNGGTKKKPYSSSSSSRKNPMSVQTEGETMESNKNERAITMPNQCHSHFLPFSIS